MDLWSVPMKIKEIIELMLAAEPEVPEKDNAGIYIPRNIDTVIKRKLLLEIIEKHESSLPFPSTDVF